MQFGNLRRFIEVGFTTHRIKPVQIRTANSIVQTLTVPLYSSNKPWPTHFVMNHSNKRNNLENDYLFYNTFECEKTKVLGYRGFDILPFFVLEQFRSWKKNQCIGLCLQGNCHDNVDRSESAVKITSNDWKAHVT